MTDLQKCSMCNCNKLLEFFKIRNNTGLRYKTCMKCCDRHKCKFDDCEYKCSTKGNLDKHIKGVHDNIRDFECKDCESKFSTQSDLNKHIKCVHRKIKDCECQYDDCESKFSTNGELNNHIKSIHTKIRDFVCQDCDFKSSKKCNLHNHIKYHCHKGNPTPFSAGEKKVMEILNKYDIDFIHDGNHNGLRSHEDKGYLRFDFIVKLDGEDFMMIEWDGRQHFKAYNFFKGEEGFERLQKNDQIKNEYCEDNKYNLLRLRYDCQNVEESILDFFAENGVDIF